MPPTKKKPSGLFGILPVGPLRKTLLLGDRPLLGILAETPAEIRTFRRSILTGAAMSIFVATYMGGIIARLPKAALI